MWWSLIFITFALKNAAIKAFDIFVTCALNNEVTGHPIQPMLKRNMSTQGQTSRWGWGGERERGGDKNFNPTKTLDILIFSLGLQE